MKNMVIIGLSAFAIYSTLRPPQDEKSPRFERLRVSGLDLVDAKGATKASLDVEDDSGDVRFWIKQPDGNDGLRVHVATNSVSIHMGNKRIGVITALSAFRRKPKGVEPTDGDDEQEFAEISLAARSTGGNWSFKIPSKGPQLALHGRGPDLSQVVLGSIDEESPVFRLAGSGGTGIDLGIGKDSDSRPTGVVQVVGSHATTVIPAGANKK